MQWLLTHIWPPLWTNITAQTWWESRTRGARTWTWTWITRYWNRITQPFCPRWSVSGALVDWRDHHIRSQHHQTDPVDVPSQTHQYCHNRQTDSSVHQVVLVWLICVIASLRTSYKHQTSIKRHSHPIYCHKSAIDPLWPILDDQIDVRTFSKFKTKTTIINVIFLALPKYMIS